MALIERFIQYDYLEKIKKYKKFFLNFSFRSLANFISKFFGLITLPIITRALGPETFGSYNLIQIIVQYTIIPVGLLGLRKYGIREIANGRKNNTYVNEIISLHLSVAIIAVIVSALIVFVIFRDNLTLLFATFLAYIIVFANVSDIEFFYVAKKDLAFPTIARLIGQLVYVLGVFLFIKTENDLWVLVILLCLTPTISNIIQFSRYNRKFGELKIKISLKSFLPTLKNTYKLGLTGNLEYLYPSIPQVLIPIFLGTYSLGIYAGGYKVYSIITMFFITFFYALAPYLVKINSFPIAAKRKYHIAIFFIIIFFSCVIGLVLYFVGEFFVVLFLGNSFADSIGIFKTISITLIPIAPVVMLLGNILIYSGYEQYYLYSLILASIITALLSPFLLTALGPVGAIFAIFTAILGATCFMLFYYFKIILKNE